MSDDQQANGDGSRRGDGDPDHRILDAITANLEGSGIVTGFVLVAEFTDEDGDARIICDSMTDQRCHRSMGLLAFGMAVEEARAQDSWRGDADD